MEKRRILIADQDTEWIETLRPAFVSENFELVRPDSLTPVDILHAIAPCEAALIDAQTMKGNFHDLLESLRERAVLVPLIALAPADKGDLGFTAMKSGATDFLTKPVTPRDAVVALKKSLERHSLTQKKTKSRTGTASSGFSGMIAKSALMQDIFGTIRKIADYKTTCLVMGESGTGKELIARAIHYNSIRKDRPFITVNCGAIPENLLESELFGHTKGAFTGAVKTKKGLFEEADTGTIFLDEIGELPLLLQVKLLRVIQEEEVRKVGDTMPTKINVRIVAATLKDLEKEVEKGTFREDLYYRLNVLPMVIPPLRERREDIPDLVEHFIAKMNEKLGSKVLGADPAALKILMEYDWPGNIRELENTIERAMILVTGDFLTVDKLPKNVASPAPSKSAPWTADSEELSIKKLSRLLEEDLIVKALKKASGNRTRAAKLLEISHRALLYKLKKYKLEQKVASFD